MTTKIAYVFPGQGSQQVGMLQDIAANFKEVSQTFARASDILNYDLWQIVIEGPKETLDQTEITQPALLTASYAIWQILQNAGLPNPEMLAGHSLGEYTALVCANALSFEDAVQLVAARGQYMQAAVTQGAGAMAAIIGLANDAVMELCQKAVQPNEVLQPANYNSIGQVVIAGHKHSVEVALQCAKENGAKLAVMIPVSVPSHCKLMVPAAERLAQDFTKVNFSKPRIPVVSNATVTLYKDAQDIREGLMKQLYQPVRWVETIQLFVKSGITQVVECGPGKVLTGLNKRIDKTLTYSHTADLENLLLLIDNQSQMPERKQNV